MPPSPRILADDLTGALDSAAAFAVRDRPLPVLWRSDGDLPPVGAVDAATREGSEAAAAARHRGLASWLLGGAPAFKKIDSLLRGHAVAEIAALASADPARRTVIAPAFPFHGRVTRGGRQWRLDPLEPVGPDLAGALAARDPSRAWRFTVHDAESDADLDVVVARELARGGPILWVGTGGLAAALARALASTRGVERLELEGPLLALVGSNHPASVVQIARMEAASPGSHVVLGSEGDGGGEVASRIARGKCCVATVAFEGDRARAAQAIADAFARLLGQCPRPGWLFVAGGETLRDVATALGARSLAVEGALEPGVPFSRLVGGRFDGMPVVSKSGAFGGPDLLVALARRGQAEPPRA